MSEQTESKATFIAVKPVDDVTGPTASSMPNHLPDADDATTGGKDENGWGISSVLFILIVFAIIGGVFWWTGGLQWAKRLLNRREWAHYRKMDTDRDLEK